MLCYVYQSKSMLAKKKRNHHLKSLNHLVRTLEAQPTHQNLSTLMQ